MGGYYKYVVPDTYISASLLLAQSHSKHKKKVAPLVLIFTQVKEKALLYVKEIKTNVFFLILLKKYDLAWTNREAHRKNRYIDGRVAVKNSVHMLVSGTRFNK